MIIEKEQYWNKVVDHYYDNIHWVDGAPRNIYDWLETEFTISSDTGSSVLEFKDASKATFFVMRFGS